jgi:hypothetical protein
MQRKTIACMAFALAIGAFCAEAWACPACLHKKVEVPLNAADISILSFLMDQGLDERGFADSDLIVEKDLSERIAILIERKTLLPCDIELLDHVIDRYDVIVRGLFADPIAQAHAKGVVKHLELLKARMKICLAKIACVTCKKHPCECTETKCCGKCSTPQCTCGGKEPTCCPPKDTIGGQVGNYTVSSCRGPIVNGGTQVMGTGKLGTWYAAGILQEGQRYGDSQYKQAVDASLVPCVAALPWCWQFRGGAPVPMQRIGVTCSCGGAGCASCGGVVAATRTVVRHGRTRTCAAWRSVTVEREIYQDPPNGQEWWCDCPEHRAWCVANGYEVWQLVPCHCSDRCTRCRGGGCGGRHASFVPRCEINPRDAILPANERRRPLARTVS